MRADVRPGDRRRSRAERRPSGSCRSRSASAASSRSTRRRDRRSSRNSVPPVDLPSAISLQSGGAQPRPRRRSDARRAAPRPLERRRGVRRLRRRERDRRLLLLSRAAPVVATSPSTTTVASSRASVAVSTTRANVRRRCALLSVLAMSSLFAAGYLSLLPVLANAVFGRGPTGFATLAAVAGIGSTIGALTTAFRDVDPDAAVDGAARRGLRCERRGVRARRRRGRSRWSLSVVVGVFYFSAHDDAEHARAVPSSDENMRGRISSLFVIGWAGLVPIAGLWQGVRREPVRRPDVDAHRRRRHGGLRAARRAVPLAARRPRVRETVRARGLRRERHANATTGETQRSARARFAHREAERAPAARARGGDGRSPTKVATRPSRCGTSRRGPTWRSARCIATSRRRISCSLRCGPTGRAALEQRLHRPAAARAAREQSASSTSCAARRDRSSAPEARGRRS